MPETNYSVEEVKSQLEAYVAECVTQAEAARALGISDAYMSDLILGQRKISAAIAAKLGFIKKVVYVHEGEQA